MLKLFVGYKIKLSYNNFVYSSNVEDCTFIVIDFILTWLGLRPRHQIEGSVRKTDRYGNCHAFTEIISCYIREMSSKLKRNESIFDLITFYSMID